MQPQDNFREKAPQAKPNLPTQQQRSNRRIKGSILRYFRQEMYLVRNKLKKFSLMAV